ncbi:FtsX-like permease family protein [Kitasatospora sp. NPDC050543]|uniref:FtsX-like permease family protein n=1 Tax=Kitasatospora sp. NPDC050543 TaxID=3364054 RepID=UPI0037A983E1
MKLSAWSVALRIARRDALRAKGRSALIVAMVALPVLGVAGADVVHRSGQLTPVERVERLMGGADALISAYAPGKEVQQAPFAEDGVRAEAAVEGRPATAEQQRGATTEPAALVAGLLLPGTTLTPARPGPEAGARSREGLLRTETTEADLTRPLWSGRLDLVKGRAPGAPHEAAVTQAFLDESGLRLGDVTTLKGLEAAPFTLTGVVEHPGDLSKVEFIGRPGEVIAPLAALADAAPAAGAVLGAQPAAGQPAAGQPAAGQADAERSAVSKNAWLVQLPAGARLDWAKVQEFNRYGYSVTSRTVALDPPAGADVPYYQNGRWGSDTSVGAGTAVLVGTVAGMALLEVALLAGPAFAVGARRSRRQLALLAAAGGHRGHVRAVVLGSGIVLGLAGALGGVLLGSGLVVVLRAWIEQAGGSRFGHIEFRPLDLLAIAAVGVVTALLAAVLPAVQASRRDITAGLAGRDTVTAPSKWVTVLGLLMVAGGVGAALYGTSAYETGAMPVVGGFTTRTLSVLGGAVTAELGLLLFTPLLLSLCGRLARSLPLGPRLALRDSARHRARTAPAVAAVMAAVAGAVAVGVYTAGSDAQARADYRPRTPVNAVTLTVDAKADSPELPQLRRAVEQDLAGLGERADLYQAVHVFCAGCQSTVYLKGAPGGRPGRDQEQGRLVAGDAAALRNLFGLHDPAAESALAAGKVVVFDRAYLQDGKAVLQLRGSGGGPTQPGEIPKPAVQEVPLDAVLIDNPAAARFGPALVSPATVQKAGLRADPIGSVWLPADAPGGKSEQRAAATAVRIMPYALLDVERGYQPKSDVATLSLSAFAALIVIGAAAIATGLAAADSRQDQATLAAIGAPPRIRRTQAGLQCALIALIGAALGTVSGFVPALGLLRSRAAGHMGPTAPLAVPWTTIALLVLALPVLAGLLSAALTRSRVPLTRRAS